MPRLPAEVGVDVDEHPPAHRRHLRRQPLPVGVVARVEPPVPPELLAGVGRPRPAPVLQPEPGQRHLGGLQRRELAPHHLGAALQPRDQPLVHPVRQRPHPPGIVGIGLDQLERRPPVEDPPGHHPRPDLHVELVAPAHVEGRVFEVLQEHRAQPRGDELRRRALGDVGAAAAVAGEEIDRAGDDPPPPPDAVLLHQDRQEVALLVEVGELQPEAEEALLGARPEPERDAVHPRRLVLHPHREAQLVRRRGREPQPVADLARPARSACPVTVTPSAPPVTAAIVGHSQCAATSSLISNDPSGIPLTRLRKVARSATRKLPVGVGLPEHPLGLGPRASPPAPRRAAAGRSRRPARRRPPPGARLRAGLRPAPRRGRRRPGRRCRTRNCRRFTARPSLLHCKRPR